MDPFEGMRVSRCMGGRRAAGHDRRSQADCPAHFGVIPGDPARRADDGTHGRAGTLSKENEAAEGEGVIGGRADRPVIGRSPGNRASGSTGQESQPQSGDGSRAAAAWVSCSHRRTMWNVWLRTCTGLP